MLKERQIKADFCVIGGGMSGICAAVAAARLGSRVVLVQDRSVLGGNASSEVRMHIVGADCHGGRPGARETGILEELRLENSVRNPQRSYAQWDLLLYETVVAEPLITLLLNAVCVGCEMDGETIRSAKVERQSTEETFEITARFFADCSGDGRLGLEAGADFRMGRESREEHGESKAQEQADVHTLGSTILFQGREYAEPQPFAAPSWVRQFTKEDFQRRPISGYGYGFWWVEWGGHLDTIRDNDAIRHELLRITLGVWNYIKNSGEHPNSANWALDWMGSIPGKRESRRFLGPHILTQNDVEAGRMFEDQVAYGGWHIDLHPVAGVDAVEEWPCTQYDVPLFGIPLRALHSRNVRNLLFAGRNISATHVAFASTRVMATCSVMGQAIGTAAAVLTRRQGELWDCQHVREIQQTLLREDAFLLGIRAEDPADLAQSSLISAKDEAPHAPARNIGDGWNRQIPESWGDGAEAGPHCWESLTLPSFLDLAWPEAQEIREIHLTFCTGLERELTLSPCMEMPYQAQPETVKDYRILLDGAPLVEVNGNYQRKRKHRFPAVRGKRLRIEILSTHGLPAARIVEVRVY